MGDGYCSIKLYTQGQSRRPLETRRVATPTRRRLVPTRGALEPVVEASLSLLADRYRRLSPCGWLDRLVHPSPMEIVPAKRQLDSACKRDVLGIGYKKQLVAALLDRHLQPRRAVKVLGVLVGGQDAVAVQQRSVAGCADAFRRGAECVRASPRVVESCLGSVGVVESEVVLAQQLDRERLGLGELRLSARDSTRLHARILRGKGCRRSR